MHRYLNQRNILKLINNLDNIFEENIKIYNLTSFFLKIMDIAMYLNFKSFNDKKFSDTVFVALSPI